MKNKYFFKNQSSLQRKAIAGGLTATFVFGTVGSGFAGAMEENQIHQINLEVKRNKLLARSVSTVLMLVTQLVNLLVYRTAKTKKTIIFFFPKMTISLMS